MALLCPAFLVLLISSGGCATSKIDWRCRQSLLPLCAAHCNTQSHSISEAELLYAAARVAERNGDDACVDDYFAVAQLTLGFSAGHLASDRRSELHRSALQRLVESATRLGRLDPNRGIDVTYDGVWQTIPFEYRGFAWEPAEFQCLRVVGDYQTDKLRKHCCPGIGLPLVVTNRNPLCRPFLPEESHFVATLTMESGATNGSGELAAGNAIDSTPPHLVLYNPQRIRRVVTAEGEMPLAADLSAAIAFRMRNQPDVILESFFNPAEKEGESRLLAVEPYSRGKIPIVFVHGLLSDPYTWVPLINDLLAQPEFIEKYYPMFFDYPTGQPFLQSAERLRSELQRVVETLDPEGQIPAMQQMVLVGHSMGGLVAKLQVAESGSELWDAVSRLDFDQVRMQPQVRERLAHSFFFHPNPNIRRVVFMATPHRGSVYARRIVGRIASGLVSEPDQLVREHRQLIQCNPGVFRREFAQRVPTSIDLLEPSSLLLQAMTRLPIPECTCLHSVIGDAKWTLGYGPSDGVVPVSSAREPRAVSELILDEKHPVLHKSREATCELERILLRN